MAHTVQRMQRDLEMLNRGLDARLREAGWNAVAGNVGRTPAAVRLYLAAEEAVAWTAPAVSHASETSADLEAMIEGPMRKDPIDIAVTSLSSFRGRKGDLPMPRLQHEHAFTADQLFMALRFAFLQDNEVLPTALREVTDPKTGKRERVKTHDKATRITGKRYSFRELWNAFEDKRDRKVKGLLPAGARREFSEALQTDIEAKRQASELRQRPAQNLSGDARKAMSALGAAVRRGVLAP